MRIVLILDHAHMNGGLAKVAFDSALGLKARGHEPVVFAAVAPVGKELVEAGIPVHCLGQSELVQDPNRAGALWRGLYNGEARSALAALLAAQPKGETVVHVHGWAKALSASIALAIGEAGHPGILTLHDYYMVCPTGAFHNYRRFEHCTLSPLSPRCLATQCDTRAYPVKLWRTARTMAAKYFYGMPQVLKDVVCFHAFQRAIIAPHLPEGTRLHEIANPIEVENLGPKVSPASGEILYVGRVSHEKGVLLYCEGMRRAGLTPVIVGDGPQADEVRARYPETRMLGWHDGAGVRERLRAARALVFPSRLYEGQPLTVLESIALGTPVITGDGSAGRESVLNGETGLWFAQGDADDLARAIRALGDDALVSRFSHAAHARYWADPLTVERHCARLEAVYAGLLA